MPRIARCRTGFDQVAEQFGDLRNDLCHVCRSGHLADASHHVDGGKRLARQQVVGGNHADCLAILHHRKVTDIVARHGQKRVKGIIVRPDADRVRGHDVGHRLVKGSGFGNNAVAQVAVGHDTGDLVPVLRDQQAGHPFGTHQLACFENRCTDINTDQITRDQVGYPDGHQFKLIIITFFKQLHAAAKAGTAHLFKEVIELRVFPRQIVEILFGQQIDKAVLEHGDVVGGLAIAEHRAYAETFTFTKAGKKLAIGIACFGSARPDNMQMQALLFR